MNIAIYYGGRGIIDDPTLTAVGKIQSVLEELRVNVKRYNLYEYKNSIPTLPQTLGEADGIVLASTVEWYGIGGYMLQFLDACWQFGDKKKISELYMMPVVMSRTYGEREAKLDLDVAWEILGGKPCSGICGYIENAVDLELNAAYLELIEKKAENLYRTINQKLISLPASNKIIKQKVTLPGTGNLSPEESAQLSKYVSDDTYVQTQKQDIQELANIFRSQMAMGEKGDYDDYPDAVRRAFRPKAGIAGSYLIKVEGKKESLVIKLTGATLNCGYGSLEKPDMVMEIAKQVFEDILAGRNSFQRAFMSDSMKMKGDFRLLRGLDEVLDFGTN
ncbi:MAG: SCP2 sterol-binding domain-containing protein [Lachnospiraceae bacterium]|nr:SCP2 sterol-binding domain-containing protein [Lachnospiraceae bacterium]